MFCYTIFFHLSAGPEVTPNGTIVLGLLFGRDVLPTKSPWIVALYGQYNENTTKTTSTINDLRILPFFLHIVVQLSHSPLSYGYPCPSLKEVVAYVGVLPDFLAVDTKPVLGTLVNLSQKSYHLLSPDASNHF
ncbi:uncharacterized protein RHIMIDRAFT_293372 [Rhizopus microsporus ATCC 52813]|uniref:Uncharacterized protein n=1 Tax=Rhizopus microsporus ATCC 52813 TaxID=1340429 RepID=A0A2G4SP62_RHIZD|nr:uncharacterized protein RHIMIDRAFT_293372 [Rhizopus microsporus ATCC 52813]PHZ10554.1 hypothetical protein RHIMIDRAFT_293372 [Rhizopus microsporus ATCC 52813]